jgi:hypothetical protein
MLLRCETIWLCPAYFVFPEMPFLNKQQISVKEHRWEFYVGLLHYGVHPLSLISAARSIEIWDKDSVQFNLLHFPRCCLFVCFPGVTTHCSCIFHSPVAGFSLLVFEVS